MSDRIEGWNHWSDRDFKKCPDCGSDQFYSGPSGGMSQNIKCAGCESEFNVMGPLGVDRISETPVPDGCMIVFDERKLN